jgi:tRNA (guanine37-N1)-methyltransferase
VRERFATDEISIGNFVLSGGELPALIIADAVIRLIPGVLNDSGSALNDSLMNDSSVEAPYYTRPAEYKGMKVPDVLLSGHDKKIAEWKEEQSIELTKKWKKINHNGVDDG